MKQKTKRRFLGIGLILSFIVSAISPVMVSGAAQDDIAPVMRESDNGQQGKI